LGAAAAKNPSMFTQCPLPGEALELIEKLVTNIYVPSAGTLNVCETEYILPFAVERKLLFTNTISTI
jgi:hypothetical protein